MILSCYDISSRKKILFTELEDKNKKEDDDNFEDVEDED